MERCPCCNARLAGARQCPRCAADLQEVLSSEALAGFWLNEAMTLYFAQDVALSVCCLNKALSFKKTPAVLVFRGFVIEKELPKVLALLAAGNYFEASAHMDLLQSLQAQHRLLIQIKGFTEFLAQKATETVAGLVQ